MCFLPFHFIYMYIHLCKNSYIISIIMMMNIHHYFLNYTYTYHACTHCNFNITITVYYPGKKILLLPPAQ